MTCNVLVPGHIKCLEQLSRQRDEVVVGLLTSEALRGYKEERMPYADRKYILDTVARVFPNVKVVPQNTLDPTDNLVTYQCIEIVTGDSWEETELRAIASLGIIATHVVSNHGLHSSSV